MLKRLTTQQYLHSVHDLFGAGVVVTESLEPDTEVNGLYAVGSSVATVSAWGVEQYESAAFSIATQAMADTTIRGSLVPCEPASVVDDACARTALTTLGRRVWRRPLTEGELDALVAISGTAATTVGTFEDGLVYGIAGLLQSPNFLYRVELGEPDPADSTVRRYTDWEMATRLSYTLWDTTPDDTLLDAAAAGELTTDEGLAAQVDRMIADERTRQGLENFFSEMFSLYDLDDLNKDPTVYVHMSDEVGVSAREQTLLDLDTLVFEEDGDYRTLLTGTSTHLDRKLAAIYDVPAPAREGFGETTLPTEGGRRGLLGQVSFLALAAHPTATSPTRRGMFVREVLLCQDVPPPPANLNTSIPEPSAESVTMRDRLEIHLQDEYCASCHRLTDYIGLGLENFDGLGSWRDTEGGETIDASGDLDGVAFKDAWELASVIGQHPNIGPCLTRTLYQYSHARAYDGEVDGDMVDWHAEGFDENGFRVLPLLRDLVTGPAFRRAGEVE